ncbi:MAG: tetratricopeptide repeat protein [Promethearchaeota archaeon]
MLPSLGIIVFIVIIAAALPIVFPSLLAGCITFFVGLKPEDHGGWLYYGEILIKMNKHIEALDAYETAAKLRPDISEIWVRLGNLRWDLGDFQGANQAFRTAGMP